MIRLKWRGRRTTRVSLSRTARFLILHFLVDEGFAGEPEVGVGVAVEFDPPPVEAVPEAKLAMAGPGKTYLALLLKTLGLKMPGSLSL